MPRFACVGLCTNSLMVGQETFQRHTAGNTTPASGGYFLKRNLPVGAEITPEGTHFRVWAPQSKNVSVQLISDGETKTFPLASEAGGYFSGLIPEARVNMLYKFALDSGAFPDPASRFQPE